jgi:hypothetical protein
MYRETDPRVLADIGQHIGLAAGLLEQFVAIPKRMSNAKRDELRELEHEARTAWESLWDQLGQARELVHALNRDVSAYDAARRSAGDIWLDAARVDVHPAYGGRSTFTWHTAPIAPAEAALAAPSCPRSSSANRRRRISSCVEHTNGSASTVRSRSSSRRSAGRSGTLCWASIGA